MDELDEFFAAAEVGVQALAQLGTLPLQLTIEDGHGAEGEQANHRTDFESLRASVGKAQHVVEKAVLLVPHAGVAPGVDRGRGN